MQRYALLKAYTQSIPAEFAEGSALYNTLPRLTPVNSRTPDPVQANGTWNATSYKVHVILTTATERGSNPVTITRPL